MSNAERGPSSEGEVREGFICPFCLLDLTSITQLQAHFEEQHASEDKAVLQSLKGFLNKAKKKFLNDETDYPAGRSAMPSEEYLTEYEPNNPWNWDPPPLGPSRSHTAVFKKIRSARLDCFVAETNKLIIRLNKLLTDLPTDPVKRKAHEKNIVMWADDKDVPLCPFCARSFNIARRRHHCRLCGGIMCDECSKFLTFNYAKKLVSPVHPGGKMQVATLAPEGFGSSTMTSLLAGFTGLRRSGSQGSLNSLRSVVDSMTNEQHFRICSHCMTRLEARDSQLEMRTHKPTLSDYYDKLMEYRHRIEQLLPQYTAMAESLSCGETTYNLRNAEEVRVKILKAGDNLNSMAQRIRVLGNDQEETDGATSNQLSSGPRQELLQRRIHSTASAFLKENILSLPKLPTSQELRNLQERRKLEAEARLAAEKEATRQAEEHAAEILRRRDHQKKETPKTTPVRSSNSTPLSFSNLRKKQTEEVLADTGWGADSSTFEISEADDPIIQQMNIIRNFIRQAREANRYDEVTTLEANLRELQEEFKKQQRLMNP